MAEPLLKRTLSRLRGKERSHRKTDPKVSDVPVKPNTANQTCLSHSLPSNTSSRTPSPADPSPPSPPWNHITVAKKQKWARQGSVAPPSYLSLSSVPRTSGLPSGVSHEASGQAWSQKLALDKTVECSDSLALDMTDASCVPVSSTAVQQEAPGIPPTSISTKLSGQRAYLQSLDRSSRAWVLSSGKSQASDEVSSQKEDIGSNIWYNPIPEEEDSGLRREEAIWKRRDEPETIKMAESGGPRIELGGVWIGPAQDRACDCLLEGANPSVSHHIDDITAENIEPHLSDPTDLSPASQKKGGGSSSVMDMLKSPGTVRKLSLKMKKLPELRRKLSLRSSSRAHRQGNDGRGNGDESTIKDSASSSAMLNENVISRYHLDSSAPPARPLRRSSRGRSANKGGYLSDGDSPELLPRQHVSQSVTETCDFRSFQLYVGSDPQRCSQRVTGLLTVHLLGLEEMKYNRSEVSKEVFLAIQIDGVTRARTALLTLRDSALSLNHTFHLELERARLLRIVVLTPVSAVSLQAVGESKQGMDQSQTSGGPTRNRVCCLGGVSIPPLFKGSRSQQLCVKLEPRGLLYLKLSLQEKWDTQPSCDTSVAANVFGVELHQLVEKEGSATPVPLLIQKTVAEIEQRGLKVVGLYRLCGSAAVKKELRDWFERNSVAVCLSEDLYPDVNVVTGILKDYLRELPSPLITRTLYHVVREAMILRPPPAPSANPDPQLTQGTVELLACLPPPERATLSLLLDHLSLVASFSSFNRMTHQNLAVCFGPVLLTPTQEAWRGGGAGGGGTGRGGRGGGKGFGHTEDITSAVDFKRHIEALHYLLQLWPVPTHRFPADDHVEVSPPPSPSITQNPTGLPQQRRPALRLALLRNPKQEMVVSRRGRDGPARLESPPPINRYAGDWSICGRDLVSRQEADYDEVAGSESDTGSGNEEEEKKILSSGGGGLYMDDFMDFDAPFNCRLSLKDFDTLIHDLDRELAKQINICL
ncbi:Rho GTPase-activating protein SYDE1 Synapse defective protein 1 -like protein 1 [Channa argus]|uniref:Rho GTPase-activating protein SYDE1 n=1 Tax=Channa argus TaxID=215402 RepID=A0A6G1QMS4_CHAAH|nr:Rho GTPase-activating protein SYDE1 Synapse defective protein 1 -like protein 1 [Channa argus]